MLGYLLLVFIAFGAWAIADDTDSRLGLSVGSRIVSIIAGIFVIFNTYWAIDGFFESDPRPSLAMPTDLSNVPIQRLPQETNGHGYVIVVPGQRNAEGDTTYRITTETRGEIPWLSCYTEAVGQVKSTKDGWILLDAKPVDITGHRPPNDLALTFYGPFSNKVIKNGWLFDSWFNLTASFQHKPLLILVDCKG